MAPGLVGPEKAARGKLPTDTWWHTIVPTNGKEKTGYPTQKPLGILRRIVMASSNPGSVVLDFFAGSGTTGAACLELGRPFILVDNNPQALQVMSHRFQEIKGSNGMTATQPTPPSLDGFNGPVGLPGEPGQRRRYGSLSASARLIRSGSAWSPCAPSPKASTATSWPPACGGPASTKPASSPASSTDPPRSPRTRCSLGAGFRQLGYLRPDLQQSVQPHPLRRPHRSGVGRTRRRICSPGRLCPDGQPGRPR